MSNTDQISQVVVVGPSPPPVHGVANMTVQVVMALRRLGRLAGHVDTRDPRPVSTIGRLDLTNVALGVSHAAQLWRTLGREPDATVYMPLSQEKWGFLRDAVLVAVARFRRRRLILHLHGGSLQRFYQASSAPMRWLIRSVCRQSDQAWALTPLLKRQFDGLVEASRVRCIENVVPDLCFERDEMSTRPDGQFGLLYLSNLLPEKGCFELATALQILDVGAAGWEVRIVGSGAPDVVRQLRQELARIGEDGASVRMLGELRGAEKEAQYRWADAFVYPSHYPLEGQPLVLLEALAAGLPVVSTHHAGIPETVRHGTEGLLIEPRDVDGLAAALSRLAVDEKTRSKLGQRARERYEVQYSPRRLMNDLVEALQVEP